MLAVLIIDVLFVYIFVSLYNTKYNDEIFAALQVTAPNTNTEYRREVVPKSLNMLEKARDDSVFPEIR